MKELLSTPWQATLCIPRWGVKETRRLQSIFISCSRKENMCNIQTCQRDMNRIYFHVEDMTCIGCPKQLCVTFMDICVKTRAFEVRFTINTFKPSNFRDFVVINASNYFLCFKALNVGGTQHFLFQCYVQHWMPLECLSMVLFCYLCMSWAM
jgi:hypothetical protein